MMSKNIQQHYMFTQKCLIGDLLSDVFFYENFDFPQFYCFKFSVHVVGRVRQVQILCDICSRLAGYLYSKKQSSTAFSHAFIVKTFHSYIFLICF